MTEGSSALDLEWINRAGRGLPKSRRATLESAKDELRELYGRQRKEASRPGPKRQQ